MKRKSYRIKTFSLPDDEETDSLLADLRQIAKTDGWTFSRLVKEALNEYSRRHWHGNPQSLLKNYIAPKKDPALCEMEGCNSQAKYICFSGFIDGKDRKLCNRHRVNEERKDNVRASKKLNSTV